MPSEKIKRLYKIGLRPASDIGRKFKWNFLTLLTLKIFCHVGQAKAYSNFLSGLCTEPTTTVGDQQESPTISIWVLTLSANMDALFLYIPLLIKANSIISSLYGHFEGTQEKKIKFFLEKSNFYVFM